MLRKLLTVRCGQVVTNGVSNTKGTSAGTGRPADRTWEPWSCHVLFFIFSDLNGVRTLEFKRWWQKLLPKRRMSS